MISRPARSVSRISFRRLRAFSIRTDHDFPGRISGIGSVLRSSKRSPNTWNSSILRPSCRSRLTSSGPDEMSRACRTCGPSRTSTRLEIRRTVESTSRSSSDSDDSGFAGSGAATSTSAAGGTAMALVFSRSFGHHICACSSRSASRRGLPVVLFSDRRRRNMSSYSRSVTCICLSGPDSSALVTPSRTGHVRESTDLLIAPAS